VEDGAAEESSGAALLGGACRESVHSEERAMREEKRTADRLTVFSDSVFAVIVTIMVLELKAPDQPAFSSLWPLWPTAMSYAVS